MLSRLRIGVVAICVAIGWSAQPARAQENFFAGKTVHLVIPAGPGGAFGTYGQLLSKYLAKYIPGNPQVIAQFMPGAGGIRASNYVANNAANDGTVLYIIHESAVTHQLLSPAQVMYDARKFIPIGIVSSLNGAFAVRTDAPATDIAGFRQTQIVLGSTGRGSYQYAIPMLMNRFQNTKFKMITGFPGSNDIILAVERGEVHGMLASFVAFQTSRPDWVMGKGARIIAQLGARRDPAIPNVPLLTELATSDEERALYNFTSLERALGRSIVAPAGVPPDRVGMLRSALTAALMDKELTAFCQERKIPLISGTPDDLKAAIDKAFATPPAVLDIARKYLSE